MGSDMDDAVRCAVEAVVPRVRAIRRDIHAHPELALCETGTAARIRAALAATPWRLLDPYLGTDVVGLLDGAAGGPNVTLRADIDALPLAECTGLPHQSTVPGVMHACGHDGHTAMLIGVAMVLAALRERFAGSVRVVFQPGEEVAAAGRDLVAKGVLRDPAPTAVLALHAWAGLPTGAIGGRVGAMMAAADFFTIRVFGKGGHAALPEATIDPIVIGAQLVTALQTIVARRVSAFEPAVVSVCRFSGGTNGNVIPDSVELEGTVRYLASELGPKMRAWIERIVSGICESAGARWELDYSDSYMPTINDAGVTALGRDVARRVLGPDAWAELERPSMGGEDFAYYGVEAPAAIFRLGMGPTSASLHNPHFDFNDDALRNGMLFMVAATLEALGARR